MTQDPDQKRLDDLRRELAATLTNPETGPDMLRRHAHVLDEMLMILMRGHLAERLHTGNSIERWLEMFLRVQKQCAETLKTAEAVDYMKFVASRGAASLPAPGKTGERTINRSD